MHARTHRKTNTVSGGMKMQKKEVLSVQALLIMNSPSVFSSHCSKNTDPDAKNGYKESSLAVSCITFFLKEFFSSLWEIEDKINFFATGVIMQKRGGEEPIELISGSKNINKLIFFYIYS